MKRTIVRLLLLAGLAGQLLFSAAQASKAALTCVKQNGECVSPNCLGVCEPMGGFCHCVDN